jgi:DNA-binding beta-propeller fold protein YncE
MAEMRLLGSEVLRTSRRTGQARSLAIVASLLLLVGGMMGLGLAHAASASPSAGPATPLLSPCTTGGGPEVPAYDPVNHWIYVPDSLGNNLTVLTATCHLIATIPLPAGGRVDAAAFDPQNNFVYVTDFVLDQVYVINGTALIATLGGPTANFEYPTSITYDPGDAVMLVANQGFSPNVTATNITIISGTSIGGTIPVGTEPAAIAYDPAHNEILVANAQSNNVTLLNATYLSQPHGSVSTPFGPFAIVYDPVNELDYVITPHAVSLYAGSGTAVGTIVLSSSNCYVPYNAVWSPATQRVYIICQGVPHLGDAGVVEISGTSIARTERFKLVTGALVGMTYDEQDHLVFATDFDNDTLYKVPGDPAAALPPPSGPRACAVGSDPYGPAFDPVNNAIYVPNLGSGNVSIVSAPCRVTASVSLPTGSAPIAAAFDPQDNLVYVADNNLNQVYVLDGTTVIATLAGGWFSSPEGITFDPGDGAMLVANYGSDNLTGVFGTSVIGSIGVGSGPVDLVYDPYYSSLLVTNQLGANVTVITSAVHAFSCAHASGGVGSGPSGVAFNTVVDADLVANEGTANVSILDGTGTSYGSQPTGSGPLAVAWDQSSLRMFVLAYLGHSIQELNGGNWVVAHTIKLSTSSFPLGATYDPLTDRVYVTDAGTGMLLVEM